MKKSKKLLSEKSKDLDQIIKTNAKKPMLVVGFSKNDGGIVQG
jgi:hypothetical protein